MRRANKILIAFILVLVWCSCSWATVYYVRTGGDNGNTGLTNTDGGAWKTIDYAADNVAAGDTVRVQAGTYAETVTPGVSGTGPSAMVTLVADGTVTLIAFDMTAGQDYIRVIGFHIDNDLEDNGCVTLSGDNTGLEFWNNEFENAIYNGIRATGGTVSGSLFIGNTFHNFGYGVGHPDPNGATAISINGYNNIIVSHNTITDTDCDAMFTQGNYGRFLNNYVYGMLEGGSGHPDFFQNGNAGINFTYNLMEANIQIGSGTTNDHTTNFENANVGVTMTENIFRRNVWHALGSGTIGVHTATQGFTNLRYYNNTGVESDIAFPDNEYGFAMYSGTYATVYVMNNVEYETWGSTRVNGIQVYCISADSSCDGAVTKVLDYNLAYDPDGSVTFTTPWTGQAHAQTNVNPGFSDVANDNFTLGITSGASNVGTALTYVTSPNGTGTAFAVNDAGFFRGDDSGVSQYAGALIVGDTILVGTDTVVISAISGNTITASSSFTWASGESVYYGTDSTPDIGAYPYRAGGYTLTATYTNSGGNLTVTPSDADLVRWVICYDDGIPTTVDNSSPYTCSVTGTPTVKVYALYPSKTPVVDATLDSGAGSGSGSTGSGFTITGGSIQ